MFDELEAFYPENVDNFDMGRFDEKIFAEIVKSREILTEKLMGLKDVEGICVFGATNQPWVLPDDIFMYFGVRMILDVPDQETRASFCQKMLKGYGVELNDEEMNQMAFCLRG